MLFNSVSFIVFFVAVVKLYYSISAKYRWLLLFVASCIFYGAFVPEYLLILFAIILVDYYMAILIAKANGGKRKRYLWFSISATIAVLVVFKYFNFVSENIHGLSSFLGWNYDVVLLELILPIGLSFHTFQSLSYVIEVYRGNQEPEQHLGIYATYVMFFPQLVAGPIERPQNLLAQFRAKHPILYSNFVIGFRFLLLGYFKKMVIADNLALYVDEVFGNPDGYSGNMLVLATFFFAIQIYCDFSGYSDIAIGTARILGFRLMTNFRQPYFATSVPDFWRRWHISLSTWFRDYIYIPLGGSKVNRLRWYYNLFIVFLLSGIWHGAGWTFIIWGMLHWFYFLVFSFVKVEDKNGYIKMFSGIATFLLICFAWIFFRMPDVASAMSVVTHLSITPSVFVEDINGLAAHIAGEHPYGAGLTYTLAALLLFLMIEIVLSGDYKNRFYALPKPMRWSVYYLFVLIVLLFGVYETTPHFIYFQF